MAALVLSVAGATLGGVFGPAGAIAGRLAGALAGSFIDRSLFGGDTHSEGPRLADLDVMASTEGAPVARRKQDAISEDGSAGSAIETPDDLADEASDEFDEEASARPRRRGRRGRRGGARRSRGRRERGDGAAESDAPDGDD